MKLFLKILFVLIFVLVLSYFLGPKASYEMADNTPLELSIELNELDSYLAQKEAAISTVRPDNESRVIWADSISTTAYALVYLHGFEASYGEAHPIIENFGKRYGCNIHLSRISRQGLSDPEALLTETPKAMVDSAKEAIAIGKLIGEQVIVMSTSTGSTLSTYLAANDPDIFAQLITSPNFDLADPNSKLLTKPWGKQIFRKMMGGDYREWTAPEAAKPYWNERYRIEGVIALRALIDQTMTSQIWAANSAPTFIGYYHKDEEKEDKIISIPAIKTYQSTCSTPPEQLKVIPFADGYGHVISSVYMNKNWKSVQDSIFKFTEEVLNITPVVAIAQ